MLTLQKSRLKEGAMRGCRCISAILGDGLRLDPFITKLLSIFRVAMKGSLKIINKTIISGIKKPTFYSGTTQKNAFLSQL